MSRGDWWTVAVAFVVAGISYFVGGAWVATAAVVIGICIGLWLHFRRESCVGGPEIYLRWEVPKNVAGLVSHSANLWPKTEVPSMLTG